MSMNADREAWMEALTKTINDFRTHTFPIEFKANEPGGDHTMMAVVAVVQNKPRSLTVVDADLADPNSDPAIAVKCPDGKFLFWRDRFWDMLEKDWERLVNPHIGQFNKFSIPLMKKTFPKL